MGSLDAFLAPISEPNPSGIDLRNDVRFHALERLLLPASRAARAEAPGSEPAVDWAEVLRQCEELGATGRDLRLLVIVVRALAQSEGFQGVAEGLSMLTRTIESYWPSLHPELRERASPREAAIRRINALFQLESTDDGLLCDLSHRTMFTLRGLGRFTGADLTAGSLSRAAFLAEVPSGLGEAETAALIAQHEALAQRVRTACRALATEEPAVMADLAGGVEQARTALAALEDSLSARVADNGTGVTFARLGRFLDQLAMSLTDGQAAAAAPADSATAPAGVEPGQPATADAAPAITSRRDVERMLDGIIAFYERTEPASPIPLIARRLRRMVPMTFLQLMEEMAPAGLKEVRSLAGVADEKARAKGGTDG
ncbi:type VI secretion system ImpA family N-terminal domain-containing protein [Paracoccus sp. Z118]|uniref:type VI secretion system protein TssA n=1 Tax=Paracoccus sp. Z118 TaxID=2851017 RepID=UPI001C2BB19C|nr:type VI secretion system ImpA family N-terminal domain-containing protein [Paracoccus sp. Z118]